MRLRIKQIVETQPDDAGEFIRFHFKAGDQDVHLEMTMKQATSLMARLAKSGNDAALKHGDPRTSHTFEEHLPTVIATHVDGSYGPDGNPLLVACFGRVSQAVRLSIEQASALALQLQQLSTPSGAPTNH